MAMIYGHTVVKPYPVKRVSDNVGLRDIVTKKRSKRRKIGDFPGYLSLLILLLLLLSRGSRDSVLDFMKTFPPTERILDIPGFTISQLHSVPLRRDRQRCEATILDYTND
ncbi:hypothetical protein PIB30_030308 [Stylosanthes scabra]|uniref:Uncharacterized protein n=1 Tax=Stylosanthes scabra TaxID=79078 RepID=A0ABU6RCG9_9FABA|nr:hypothetical protein [Stylosanthes scabra]